jgi:hypothetical protein
MLRFISNTQLFWFTLDTSYNHGCHLTNRFHLEPDDYEVLSPLVAPPCCCLVMPAGCRIPSYPPLIAPPSHRCCPVAPAGCCITSRRPLIALSSRHLVAPTGCRIDSRHPLVAPPSCQLVAPACCCIASPRPLVAVPPSCPLVAPAGCCGCLSTRRPLVV